MAAATTCASTSLAGQALDLSSNALVVEAPLSMRAKANASDSIGYDADPGDCNWDTAGLSCDPYAFTKNRTVNCWQLTMGRLSRSGTIYSYERTNESGCSQAKWSDNTFANYSSQRSQQSKGDKKVHLWTERKPRAPELNHMVTSKIHIDGTTTEALAVLKNRLQKGITTHSGSYIKVLQTCMKQKDLLITKQVHDCIIQSGMDKNHYVGGTLMNVYIKCGALVDARRVFDHLETKTVVDWNIIIAEYAKSDHPESAIELFNQMRQEGAKPNEITYLNILKACASPVALKWGNQIHECIRHAGFDSDVRVGTALLKMYAKCGCIIEARQVFENLTSRDVITWTVMIGGLAQHGCGHEAYRLFCQMRREGFEPSAITYLSILNASASAGALEWVKEIHGHATKAGLESDLRVGNALVHMYAKSGSIDDAQVVFDRMEKRDVITWNVMIGGLAQHECGHEAYRLFCQMRREGFEPSAITYLSILNASASVGALEWVKEVHGHATKAGLESDMRVGNALVHMYAKSGSIDDARVVFDRMEKRDVVTWNVMIGGCAQHGCGHEAYKLFCQMRREGFEPDAFTYASILSASAGAGDLQWVKEVHAHARKAGLESDLRVGSALVHKYAESGSIDDARVVFDRMENRDVVTWNVMIGGLAQHGCGHEAYRQFCQMRRDGFEPDAITYLSILNASASAGALGWVKEVHGHATKAGLESDLRVGSALVHIYAESGSIDDARIVFDRMQKRDIITWNVMIGGLAQHGCGHEAYRLFCQMRREGFEPDAVTYLSILNPAASAGTLEWVKEVHAHASKAGLESDLRVGSALVHMYAESGSIDDARVVFDRMEKRDVVTWNVMIGGLAQHGCGLEALEYFRKMNVDRVKPNQTTFVAVLSACCHTGRLDDGRILFLAMTQDYCIEPDIVHYTCMVDLLGRAGYLEEAKLFISDMPVEADGVIWTALLGACRTYGNVELGELAAKELFKLEPDNASTYVLLSNIYAAAGKWDKQELVRTMMKERAVRKEPGRSWIEVDKKIHEFVVGDLSHPEAKAIYTMLKSLTEKLKAVGYTPDTRLVLHNIDDADKELALCSHSEKLAIAYGLTRIPRGEPIRVYKNLRVCSDCHAATKLISKVTGREITVRDANRFHHFKDGVCSCVDYW
ncbi:unnamed protein product [Calypogeia fissa]